MSSTSNSEEIKMLARKEWVSANQFQPLSEAEVLREVANRVAEVRAKTPGFRPPHPLVVLDLDSTLYEVAPRSFAIVQEWLKEPESAPYDNVRAKLSQLRESDIGYSIRDSMRTAGLDLQDARTLEALQKLKTFWLERFFTSQYLPHDRAYPGAAEFAQELHALGAELVYLTGRDEPGMGEGTRANLVRDGFPWDAERTHSLLKPAADISDLEHKKQAALWLRDHGTLVASFENEPLNLVTLASYFPEAMHIFVETVSSDRAAPIGDGLYRIKGFAASVKTPPKT